MWSGLLHALLLLRAAGEQCSQSSGTLPDVMVLPGQYEVKSCPCGQVFTRTGPSYYGDCAQCPGPITPASSYWWCTQMDITAYVAATCPLNATACTLTYNAAWGVPCKMGWANIFCAAVYCAAVPGVRGCASGSYCSAGVATLCPAGYFCPLSSYAAEICPAGTYSAAVGATSSDTCVQCPPGAFCGAGSTAPTLCAAGYYSATPGLTTGATCTATPCTAPPGFGCAAGSSTAANATQCLPGFFCPGGTPARATPCSPATACPLPGMVEQLPCYWSVSTLAGRLAAGAANGQGSAAQFDCPHGVSVDPAGLNVYVGDHNSHTVRRITPAGLVSTLAGSGSGAFANGQGAGASFFNPHGVPADVQGNVYVGDRVNNRVRRISPTGLVTTFAGSGAAGGANGIGLAAQLNGPTDIAMAPRSGTLVGYVVEQTGNRIRTLDLASAAVSTLAGSGTGGFADSANGLLAQFKAPTSAVWHPSGVLYVADGSFNCRIRAVSTASTAVTTLAGNGVAGSTDGVGTAASLNQPRGLALDAPGLVLYIAEQTGHRIRTISLDTAQVRTIAGSGGFGWGQGAYADGYGTAALFNTPVFLAASAAGVLYAAECSNNVIRQLTCAPCPAAYYCASGAPVICPAGHFCPFSSLNPTLCPAGTFNAATGGASNASCAQCPAGAYCGAGAVSSTLCAAGYYSATPGLTSAAACTATPCTAPPGYGCAAGSTSAANATLCTVGSYCPGGTPAPATPCYPAAACSAVGLAAQPQCLWQATTLAGNGGTSFAEGLGTSASFNYPTSLGWGASGVLYVADQNFNRVRAVAPSGLVSTLAGSGSAAWADGTGAAASLANPRGLAVHPGTGMVYVTQAGDHRIRALSPSGVTTTLAGTGGASFADGQGTSAAFWWPAGIAVDPTGVLFVADRRNNRIRRISPQGAVTTLAGTGAGSFVNGVGTISATFNFPEGVAVDASGNVYVGDQGNNAVRLIRPSGAVSTFAGSGAAAWVDGTGTGASIALPHHLAAGADGDLLVVDLGNSLIRRINPLGQVSTIVGGGTAAFLDGYGTASRFDNPVGIAVSATGIVAVADSNNHRVRLLTCAPCPASYHCSSGAPTICPAGFFCPLFSFTPIACPAGTFSAATGAASNATCAQCPAGAYCGAGAVSPTLCAAGYYSATPGLTSAAACTATPCTAPPGYGCAAGSTSAANATLCTVGSYCPGGTPAPMTPCHPVTACTLPGLAALPPCLWSVSTFAGSGAVGAQDGQGTVAQFNGIMGVSVNPTTLGLSVTETGYHRVRRISATGLVGSFVGNGNPDFSNGVGNAAAFSYPHGVSIDAQGNAYVGDWGNALVRKISPANVVTSLAGSHGSGGANNGVGAAARFYNPVHVALDSSGTMGYVVDLGGCRIRTIKLSIGEVSSLAGSGTLGTVDSANGLLAQFYYPTSAAWHPSGTLYVAAGNYIRTVSIASTAVGTLAGTGVAGSVDGVGTAALLHQPWGVALDVVLSVLYFTEYTGNRIRAIALATAQVRSIAGTGTASFADGFGAAAAFSNLYHIAVSPTGALYAAGNNRVRQLQCIPCPASYFCASGAPVLCPVGSFCPQSSTNPLPCPAGTYSTAAGAASNATCVPCPASYYCASGAPVLCPAGSSCPSYSFNATPCPAGTFSGASGAIACAACPPGAYCMAGSPAPTLCPAGYYSASLGLTSSAACTALPCTAPPGFGCAAGSTSAANSTLCPMGSYCPGGSPAPALPCNPATACSVSGLAAQPPCYWNVSTLAGSGAAGWADGQGTAAVFNGPVGGFVDPATLSVFIGDYDNHRIRRITPGGLVSTLAGSGSAAFANGLGAAASFRQPYGVPVDTFGNVYVADAGNQRVRKIHPTGLVSTIAGSGAVGGANGIGAAAEFNTPSDIALESSGAVGYVVEQAGCRIRTLSLTSGVVSTLAGSGVAGYLDSANGLLAKFNNPTAAVLHPAGVLYVADGQFGFFIRRVDTASTAVTTLAGSGAAGSANGVGTAASFNRPRGISLDATLSTLFVSEVAGHCIRSISLSTLQVQTIAGSSSASFADGFGTSARFNSPLFMANTPLGILYAVDHGNNRIRQLTCVPCPASYYCASGGPVLCPAGHFCPFSSFNATACPAGAYSSAVGASSNATCLVCPAGAYCAAGATAPTLSPTGYYSATPGLATLAAATATPCSAPSGYGCAPGSTSPANSTLCAPGSYCPGGSPALVLPCFPVSACSEAGLAAQPPCYWSLTLVAGSPYSIGASNGVGTAARFFIPKVATADFQTLYVADQGNNLVRAISPTGTVTTLAGSGAAAYADGVGTSAAFNGVSALAWNPATSLLYAAGNMDFRIRTLTLSGTVSTLAGSGAQAAVNGIGAAASFVFPFGLCISSSSVIFVADHGAHQIRSVTTGGVVAAFAGSGAAAFADGTGAAASFRNPFDCAFDAFNTMYVADWQNHRVRVITPAGVVSTLAGSGTAAFSDGIGTLASFKEPASIATEAASGGAYVYVADTSNGRIRRITVAQRLVVTLVGSGSSSYQPGFGVLASLWPNNLLAVGDGSFWVAASHAINKN